MVAQPKGLSDRKDMILSKAYSNICNSKAPIITLKDFAKVKGVGKWILTLMQGFFDTTSVSSEPDDLRKNDKKVKGAKRYVPQKNSVAYALLITLYRGTANGREFMRKQDLIDAAEASGLSRVPIAPELGKGKPGQFGSSGRDWYSGWSCMKTLITKGLVVKSSCPAKYMLTQEGKEVARDCQMRSGLVEYTENSACREGFSNLESNDVVNLEFAHTSSVQAVKSPSADILPEDLARFTRMGYSEEQVRSAFSEVLGSCQNKEMFSLWPAVCCRLREVQVYGLNSNSPVILREDSPTTSTSCPLVNSQLDIKENTQSGSANSSECSFSLRACTSSDYHVQKINSDGLRLNEDALAMPPLRCGERFGDAYEVILILDDREQFASHGSRPRKIVENICKQFKIKIEIRRLPVGDGIWIARHKELNSEYVLDFIVERKNIDDLRCSIRDNRYKEQKLRLLRCGLKKLIYLVEGDPNSSEAAESIKTACFTTEILEGFDVQRTSGLGDTLRKYAYLTRSMSKYYNSYWLVDNSKGASICPAFEEFNRRCQNLDKMTVSDVFAVQLMQVPQVTEEVALAILDLYPTLFSLARAYSILEGDISAQEEMLRKQSNNMVSAIASRKIYQFVWGN